MDDTTVEKEIATLEELNTLAKTTSQAVELAKLSDEPVKDVEKELANFTRHAFNKLNDEYNFQNKIESAISERLDLAVDNGGFNNKELITLHTNHSVNIADRISKVLGPTFQLMTAEQTANIQANAQVEKQKAQVQVNIQNNGGGNSSVSDQQMVAANESADTQVLQGIFQLQNLFGMLNQPPAEEVEAKTVE